MQLPTVKLVPDYQVGDYIAKAGIYTRPGVIVEKNEDGTLTIDTDEESIKQYHRHSNTTGLTPEEKERFNSIMDDIITADGNAEKLNALQESIDTLSREDGTKKVVQSLRNEQAQLIRHARELPRVYQYPDKDIVR